MKCFYHNDLDGKCSAFWVNIYYKGNLELKEINYESEFPFDEIERGEEIWIVDYSIEPEEMKKLKNITDNVVWIDHHKSAIKKYEDFPFEIEGIRKDGTAGCVLTYNYLYPDKELNKMTAYIGDWDVWEFKYGKKTEYFKMGMESYITHPDSFIWEKALDYPEKIIEEGKIVSRFKSVEYEEYIKQYGYEVEFEGYNCIACNRGNISSKLFNSVEEEYDILIAYIFNGEQYTVSLYSTKIDVSEIAEKYGGGGHEGASGFQCDELPF